MSEDFYPFVDSGDPAPDNTHLTGNSEVSATTQGDQQLDCPTYTTRISVYDDMLSTPRVIVVEQSDVRTYLEDVTNTVHRTMKEQGGHLSLMIIRELVENFIHAQFSEPVISILDDGDTIRFADQGPGINDKERAFEFGVTSADRMKKRYIRGTGAGLPMVQQYVEAAGGAISVEDNLGTGTVVTVSVNPKRVAEIEHAVSRGAAVRSGHSGADQPQVAAMSGAGGAARAMPSAAGMPGSAAAPVAGMPGAMMPGAAMGMPGMTGAMMPSAPMGAAAWPGMAGGGAQGAAPNPYGFASPDPYASPEAYGAQAAQQPMLGGDGFLAYPQQQAGYFPQGYPWPQTAPWPGAPNPYGMPFAPGSNGMPGGGAQMTPGTSGAGPHSAALHVSERGELALRFIAQNGKGGPTDLTRAFGNSDATWSRELDALAGTGLIYKRGQKYVLTEMGLSWSTTQQG